MEKKFVIIFNNKYTTVSIHDFYGEERNKEFRVFMPSIDRISPPNVRFFHEGEYFNSYEEAVSKLEALKERMKMFLNKELKEINLLIENLSKPTKIVS